MNLSGTYKGHGQGHKPQKHALYKISLSLEWYEHIPTFNEHKIAQHVWDFMNFTEDLNISHEDVMMWLFPFTLKESAIVAGCSLVLSYIIAVGVLW